MALKRPPGWGGGSLGPPRTFLRPTERRTSGALSLAPRPPGLVSPAEALVSYSEEAGGGGPVDGQAAGLLPQEQLGLPESLGHPVLLGTARRKVSFRCICGKWAVRGFLASLRFRCLAGKHVFPIFHILRTPSRMDVVPARQRQENRLSLAKTGRSPEQPVSLTTCLYSQGRKFWPFGAFSPVSECSVVFWAQ